MFKRIQFDFIGISEDKIEGFNIVQLLEAKGKRVDLTFFEVRGRIYTPVGQLVYIQPEINQIFGSYGMGFFKLWLYMENCTFIFSF